MQTRVGKRDPTVVDPHASARYRRGLAVAVAATAVAALAWFLLREEPSGTLPAASPVAGEIETVGPRAVVQAPLAGPVATAAGAPGRAVVEPGSAAPVDFRRPTRVVGRCLADGGVPLAGCALSLRVLRLVPELDPRPHTSDAEGRFAVEVPPSVALEICIRAPGRVTRIAPLARLDPGAEVNLGDIVLQLGRRVAGTVRDDKGMPIEGALVRLLREPTVRELRYPTRPLRVLETRSTAMGGIEFGDPAKPDKWRVAVSLPAAIKPSMVTIEPRQGDFMLDVVVEQRELVAEIGGVVRDERGGAVAGAEVQAWRPAAAAGKDVVVARAIAAADGSFVVSVKDSPDQGGKGAHANAAGKAPAGENTPVRLRVLAAGCEFLPDERLHAWGTRGVDLRVHRSDAIAVRVTCRDGRPVENFALHVFPPRPADVTELRARSRGYHEDGLAYAHGVLPGPQVVLVDSPHLVADGVRRLSHHGFATRLDVVLDPPVTRRLRVVGRDGRAAAAATVELLVPLTDTPIDRFTPGAKLMDLWNRSGERALRVVSSFLDGDGMADLVGHPDTRYALRIKSDRHAPYFAEIVLGPLQPLTEICLADGARVEGVVQPARFVSGLRGLSGRGMGGRPPIVSLTPMGGQTSVRYETAVDEHGRFAFEHMAPGDWQVGLSWQTPMGQAALQVDLDDKGVRWITTETESGGERASRPQHVRPPSSEPVWSAVKAREQSQVLAAVPGLADGETRHVVLRVDAHVHATLRGRLVGADPSWVNRARLVAIEPDGPMALLPLDEAAAYCIAAEPGDYHCEVSADGERWWRTGQRMSLLAGQACAANLVVDLVQLRLRTLDAKGAPQEGVCLRLSCHADTRDVIKLPPTNSRGEVVAYVSPAVFAVLLAETSLAEVDTRHAVVAGLEQVLRLPSAK